MAYAPLPRRVGNIFGYDDLPADAGSRSKLCPRPCVRTGGSSALQHCSVGGACPAYLATALRLLGVFTVAALRAVSAVCLALLPVVPATVHALVPNEVRDYRIRFTQAPLLQRRSLSDVSDFLRGGGALGERCTLFPSPSAVSTLFGVSAFRLFTSRRVHASRIAFSVCRTVLAAVNLRLAPSRRREAALFPLFFSG